MRTYISIALRVALKLTLFVGYIAIGIILGIFLFSAKGAYEQNSLNREAENYVSQNTEKISRLISSLENYKKANGRYPEKADDAKLLEELSFDIPPSRSINGRPEFYYKASYDGDFYVLEFSIYRNVDLYVSGQYSSINQQWRFSKDGIPPFNSVQAQYYGERWQKSRDAESLQFALTAEVKNRTFSERVLCPQLFVIDIERLLGQGQAVRFDLPNVRLHDRQIKYTSSDGISYVLDIKNDSSGRPYRLDRVKSIYKFRESKGEWQLITSCAGN